MRRRYAIGVALLAVASAACGSTGGGEYNRQALMVALRPLNSGVPDNELAARADAGFGRVCRLKQGSTEWLMMWEPQIRQEQTDHVVGQDGLFLAACPKAYAAAIAHFTRG